MSSGADLPVRDDLEKAAELASVSVSKPVAAVSSDLESIASIASWWKRNMEVKMATTTSKRGNVGLSYL